MADSWGSSMSAGIFVTGTDTGVGKTYVSALALRLLRVQGVDVGAMKPIETGVVPGNTRTAPAGGAAGVERSVSHWGDAELLLKASGATDELHLVSPYRFKAPVAPIVAARMEGGRIDPSRIRVAFHTLSSRHAFVLVEGAGGILVPVTEAYSMADLAVDLGLPVIIVASSVLGAINHTLLTLEACKARGLTAAGVVLNNMSPGSDQARRTNLEVLSELVEGAALELGFGAGVEDADGLRSLLAKIVQGT